MSRSGFPDIRRYKRDMRERCKRLRDGVTGGERSEKDRLIEKRLRSTQEYKSCDTLLCYVSMGSETGTHGLIESAVADGKIVGVPRCRPGSREMDFYRITSLSQLAPGTYGVMEPEPLEANLIRDFKNSLCVLPGLAFDLSGYRLGYGGGYYDRFLSGGFCGKTAGICYNACVVNYLRHGRFDIPCDMVVTEIFLKKTAKAPNRGPRLP